ncbi:hypothetical protein Ancab_021522 [Ancistrocladus abbreviatus]
MKNYWKQGDSISCNFTIGDDCTAVLTTQASTKVYKSVGMKCSEQMLEARVGSNALFVVTPDPVTCFSTARYSQKQVFRVLSDSNLVVVDWFTSGRYESGEKCYKSSNNIYLEDHQPLFLDTVISLDGSLQDPVCRSHLNKDCQQKTVSVDGKDHRKCSPLTRYIRCMFAGGRSCHPYSCHDN